MQIALRVLVLAQKDKRARRFLSELVALGEDAAAAKRHPLAEARARGEATDPSTPGLMPGLSKKAGEGGRKVELDMDGMTALFSQFDGGSMQLGPAYAFIATIVKDHCAVAQVRQY